MRVTAKILGISRTNKTKLTSDLQQNWMLGRRSAAGGRRGGESSERLQHKREHRAELLECGRERSGTGQNGLRGMSQRMNCAGAMIGMPEGAFRFFHLGPHGVQVVGSRDHGKQQHENAAESASEDERARRQMT